jgi:DNA-binding FadR family transcriptional regulator
MRRGPGGGLFVAAPSAAAVTDVVAIYLAYRGMDLKDVMELRLGVEVALVDLAVDRIDEGGAAKLQEALEHEATASEKERARAVHDLHAAIAGVSQNQVLGLVALVMIRLSRLYQIEKLAEKDRKKINQEVLRTHDKIARAVASGDKELARHRMRRHLEALANYIR